MTFTWTGTDDVTLPQNLLFQYQLDTYPWSAWSTATSTTFSGLNDGVHSVQIRAQDQAGNIQPTPTTCTFWVDTTLPIISNVQATPGIAQATITWQTNEPTMSQVDYGLTASCDTTAPVNGDMVQNHLLTLTGLQPNTQYYYDVRANDGCVEAISPVQTFTTAPAPNLAVTAVTNPSSANNSATITVGWTVQNTGGSPASGSWVDRVYLATDQTLTNTTLLGVQVQSATLAAGANYTTSLDVTLPTRMTAGSYYLVVYTDYDNVINAYGTGLSYLIGPQPLQVTLAPQPDLTPVAPVITPATAIPGSTQTFTFSVLNQGAPTLASNAWCDAVYLSTDAVLSSDDIQLAVGGHSGVLNSGESYTVTLSGALPEMQYGDYYLLLVTDSTNMLFESAANNVVAVPITLVPGIPDLVPVQLTVTPSVAPRQPFTVSWNAVNHGTGRTDGSWTDALYLTTNGQLDAQSIPLTTVTVQQMVPVGQSYAQSVSVQLPPNTAPGNYQVLLQLDAGNALDELNINNKLLTAPLQVTRTLALIAAPDLSSQTVQQGQTVTGTLSLTNLADVPLTGLTVVTAGLAPNLQVTLTPPASIAPGATATLSYQLTALDASVLNDTFSLALSTQQGAAATVYVQVTVTPNLPNLTVTPDSLHATMLRGQQTTLTFSVVNTGAATASQVMLELPSVTWLQAVSPLALGDLAPGAQASVTLVLAPDTTLQLGAYTGALVLQGTNCGVSVPFSFQAITNNTATLIVNAQDEYTFFAAGSPQVAGAQVLVLNPTDGSVAAQGETDMSGVFTVPNLTEGYYTLQVSAAQHSNYQSVIYVDASTPLSSSSLLALKRAHTPSLSYQARRDGPATPTVTVNAFLPLDLVTYSWSVVPTTVQDVYDIQVTATFVTNVPAPVVTVDPMYVDFNQLSYDATGKAVVNYTVTNHGLIAASSASLTLPASVGGYTVTPLLSALGTLPAQSSVVVPVVIQQGGATSTGGRRDATPCVQVGNVTYTYICGIPIVSGITLTVVAGNCGSVNTTDLPSGNSISVGYGNGGGSGGGGGGGSGGGGGGGGGGNPSVSSPTCGTQLQIHCAKIIDCFTDYGIGAGLPAAGAAIGSLFGPGGTAIGGAAGTAAACAYSVIKPIVTGGGVLRSGKRHLWMSAQCQFQIVYYLPGE